MTQGTFWFLTKFSINSGEEDYSENGIWNHDILLGLSCESTGVLAETDHAK